MSESGEKRKSLPVPLVDVIDPPPRRKYRHYATEEERQEAKRQQQAEFLRLKKSGQWVRKNRIFSERIARKALNAGEVEVVDFPPDPMKADVSDRKARTEAYDTLRKRIADAKDRLRKLNAEGRAKDYAKIVEARDEMALAKAQLESLRQRYRKYIERKISAQEKKQTEELARRQQIFETYGFWPGAHIKDLTPEELEGRRRYERDKMKVDYRRNLEKNRKYNKEYRQKRRAKELAERQKVWSAEEWEAWRRKQEAKVAGPGTPVWLVKEVAAYLAEQEGICADDAMAKLVEVGGIEFITGGAEAIARQSKHKAKSKGVVAAAARALMFFVDPDKAVMFPVQTWRRPRKKIGDNGSVMQDA